VSEEIRDECGLVVCHSLHDTYKALKALQHRGQETAGIAARNHDGIDVIKWTGLVTDFSLDNLEEIISGDLFIGHVRYSTCGKKERELRDAHPHYIGGTERLLSSGRLVAEGQDISKYWNDIENGHVIVRGAELAGVHNGTLVNHSELCAEHEECDTATLVRLYKEIGLHDLMRSIPAAYSAAILTKEEVLAFRDRYGIRPLWLGKKDGRYVVMSENSAIREIGGKPVREVRPGEAVRIFDSEFSSEKVLEPDLNFCFFEYNYLANPDSRFNEMGVADVRYNLGVELAMEFRPADLDLVTYVPRAPEPCARGYEAESGVRFVKVFYKQDDSRSFMKPLPGQRSKSIESNLYVSDKIDLKGKDVLVIDDSIVRGNVNPEAVRKIREAGARKVYYASVTPPIGPVIDGVPRGCLYGVDMPPTDDFAIRKYGGIEGIKEFSGADELYYLSLEGMLRAIRLPESRLCTYCIGGRDPLYESAHSRSDLLSIKR